MIDGADIAWHRKSSPSLRNRPARKERPPAGRPKWNAVVRSGVVVDQIARCRGTRPAADLADSGKGFSSPEASSAKLRPRADPPLALLLALPAPRQRLVGDVHVELVHALLAEHAAQPVHLAFQGVRDAGVGTGESPGSGRRSWMRTSRRPSSAGVELDLRRLQVLAGHPHHPVHHRLAPAVLHRHRLAGHRAVHRTVGQACCAMAWVSPLSLAAKGSLRGSALAPAGSRGGAGDGPARRSAATGPRGALPSTALVKESEVRPARASPRFCLAGIGALPACLRRLVRRVLGAPVPGPCSPPERR